MRQRRAALKEHLQHQVRETTPLDEGYAFRFDATDAVLRQVLHLIQQERTCCRFLTFTLRVTPDEGPLWLELTGPPGTKAFLEEVFLP